MAFQPPGAEFLKRRLARATAVPPAERSANVAAFVESMQLMLDNPELLPLNSEGTAALPDTADRRSKVGWPAGCHVTPPRQLAGQPRPVTYRSFSFSIL